MVPTEVADALQALGVTILAVMGIAGIVALVLFVMLIAQARKIDVPPGAGFGETLLHTPLIVVLFLDTMDLALDILGAPLAWIILDRLGLKALRGVAAIEALIPFTQVIPVMTISWIVVRLLGAERIDAVESAGSYSQYKRAQQLPPGDDSHDYYSD